GALRRRSGQPPAPPRGWVVLNPLPKSGTRTTLLAPADTQAGGNTGFHSHDSGGDGETGKDNDGGKDGSGNSTSPPAFGPSPTPEPSTVVLALCAAIPLAFSLRRRRTVCV